MPFKQHSRQYDLVVFGATGYTGQYTAEHIVTHLPSNLRWAVAGRSEGKLRDLVAECKKPSSDRSQPGIEICNLSDEELGVLAKKTFILITTVGPYTRYGEHAFKACAENGTHYLDVTGEISWTFKMMKKYEEMAKVSGAIMIPQIGVESAPSDLCAWSLATVLRTKLSAQTGAATVSVYDLSSSPSGGTLQTAFGLFETTSLGEFNDSQVPYALSPVANPTPGPNKSFLARLTGLTTVSGLGLQTTSIGSASNKPIVERTWGLLSVTPSRKEQFYGPNFSYREYFKAKNWVHGMALHYGIAFFGFLLAFCPPFSFIVKKLASYQPGEGPRKEVAEKDYIELRAVANPDPPCKKQAFCKAWFSGSMYHLSGVLLSHAAETILADDLELDGGVCTPACLGQKFIDRMDAAGFHIETKILDI